jgi:hypothetical protein
MDESGIIRIQMGTHNISENGLGACDAFHDTTPEQEPVTNS